MHSLSDFADLPMDEQLALDIPGKSLGWRNVSMTQLSIARWSGCVIFFFKTRKQTEQKPVFFTKSCKRTNEIHITKNYHAATHKEGCINRMTGYINSLT